MSSFFTPDVRSKITRASLTFAVDWRWIVSTGACASGDPSGVHQLFGPVGTVETPITSIVAPFLNDARYGLSLTTAEACCSCCGGTARASIPAPRRLRC